MIHAEREMSLIKKRNEFNNNRFFFLKKKKSFIKRRRNRVSWRDHFRKINFDDAVLYLGQNVN